MAFVRIWRIVRKQKCSKFFIVNTQQWCESPLSAILRSRELTPKHELGWRAMRRMAH